MIQSCNKNEEKVAPKASDDKVAKPDLTDQEIRRLILLNDDYALPRDLAERDALMKAKEFDAHDKDNPAPRTISEFLVANVPDSSGVSSKHDPNDLGVPEVYVANFADNRGYVIMSADQRAYGILGYAASGTIDSLVHPGLQVFLSRTVPYVMQERKKTELLRDSIYHNLVQKFSQNNASKVTFGTSGCMDCGDPPPPRSIDQGWVPPKCNPTFSYSYIPDSLMIKDVLITSNWSQRPPYNGGYAGSCSWTSLACSDTSTVAYKEVYGSQKGRSVDIGNNSNATGCGPIAEAQVIAHFRAKKSNTWKNIVAITEPCNFTSSQRSMVASFIREIFGRFGTARQGCLSSATQLSWDFVPGNRAICPDYGLKDGEWRYYNINDITESLKRESPVLISGYPWRNCFLWWCWGGGSGHEWIIDGIKSTGSHMLVVQTENKYSYGQCRPVYSFSYRTEYYPTKLFVHHNWGWGINEKKYDEWYLEGVLNIENRGDFNSYVRIIAYITPT